jgi:hypothetical protein
VQRSGNTKGRSILFNHFIDMRTTLNLSISCRKNVFLLKFSNKNTFFLHEIDKLTVVLMSIKWLNKIEWPLKHGMLQFSSVLILYSYELWFQIRNVLSFPKNIIGNWLQCNGVATLKLRSNFFWQKSIYRSGKCQLFPSEMQEKSSSTLKILTFDCCIILS